MNQRNDVLFYSVKNAIHNVPSGTGGKGTQSKLFCCQVSFNIIMFVRMNEENLRLAILEVNGEQYIVNIMNDNYYFNEFQLYQYSANQSRTTDAGQFTGRIYKKVP